MLGRQKSLGRRSSLIAMVCRRVSVEPAVIILETGVRARAILLLARRDLLHFCAMASDVIVGVL